MCTTVRFSVLAITILGATYAGSASAISINFVPDGNIVSVGSTLTMDVKISGLGYLMAPSLSSFDLGILYNPNYLNLTGVSFGDPFFGDQLDLSGYGSLTSTTPGIAKGDLVEFGIAEVSLDSLNDLNSGQLDNFILASLTFSGKGVSNGLNSITFANLYDPAIYPNSTHILLDAANNLIPSSEVILGSSNIQVVPEPNTFLLLGVGLVSFLRKKRSKQ